MAKLGTWNTTAANNNQTPPDGWPEGQAPSTVNDCAREMMASVRTAFNDLQYFDQNLTPTFINSTSFSLAGNQTSAIHAGRRLKIFDATAGAATTIYATVLTASFTTVTTVSISADAGQLTTSLSSFAVAILSRDNLSFPHGASLSVAAINVSGPANIGSLSVAAINVSGQANIGSLSATSYVNLIPSGTRMLFQQTAAPTGWTKETNASFNDRALRLVTGTVGSGGSSAFSTVFGKTATDGHVLGTSEMPAHTHTSGSLVVGAGQGSHVHTGSVAANTDVGGGNVALGGVGGSHSVTIDANALPAMAVNSGTTGVTGSSVSHSHNIDIRVNFHDVIIAQKD